MSEPAGRRQTQESGRFEAWWPWLAGLAALLPFVLNYGQQVRLYWYGDEWDLMRQMQAEGFGPWLGTLFVENFVPLFKLLWGGAVVLTGSHVCLLWLGWLTHAANGVLLALILRRAGMRWQAGLPAVLVFGLSVTNIETLVWTVQWSASLATGFLLLALHRRFCGDGVGTRFARIWLPALLGLCSALCFSRGVLSGLLLGLSYLLPLEEGPPDWKKRLLAAQACVLPSVVVALAIILQAPGNLGAKTSLSEALYFGYLYLGQNPLHRLMEVDSCGWRTATVLLLLKLLPTAWCFLRSRAPLRSLLLLLLVLDIGNACLLGLGRYQTGAEASVSYRYQYISLLCHLPAVCWAVERVFWALCGGRRVLARRLQVGGCLLLGLVLLAGWRSRLPSWVASHGEAARVLLHSQHHSATPTGMPGVEFISPAEARQLVQAFELDP